MLEQPDIDLESDIIFGVYAPGMRITEEQIMEQYDVKRHVVRSAFSLLENQGLLIRKPNKGVEVISYNPDEVDELYDIRMMLEKAATRRTQLPAPTKIIRQLEKIAKAHEKAIKNKNFREIYKLNQEFHEYQYSCCNNQRLVRLIKQHARMAQPIRVIKYDDDKHMQTIIAQHMDIIEALKGTCAKTYEKSVENHLPASAKAYRTIYESRFGKASK